MRSELAIIEKIEMYIMGTMNDTQKNAFENSMRADSELQMQTAFQTDLMEGIIRFGLKNATRKAYRSYNFKKWILRSIILLLLLLFISASIILISKNSENNSDTNENKEVNKETILAPDTASNEANKQILTDTTFEFKGDSIVQATPLIQSQKKIQSDKKSDNTTMNSQIIPESNINSEIKKDHSVQSNPISTTSKNSAEKENKLICQWKIHQETGKEELNKIAREIEACNGKIETSSVNYKNGGVSKISFEVSNKSGKVEYHSPDLRGGFIICINFYEEGISAGVCDDRLNEIETENDSLFIRKSNNLQLTKKEKEEGNQLLSVDSGDYERNNQCKEKRKIKRKRFFTQTERFESGRKRGDYKSKKKYYR